MITGNTKISELYHSEDELKHFGVLGMKWGVRRYQNEDGSLTNVGKQYQELNRTSKQLANDLIKCSKQLVQDHDDYITGKTSERPTLPKMLQQSLTDIKSIGYEMQQEGWRGVKENPQRDKYGHKNSAWEDANQLKYEGFIAENAVTTANNLLSKMGNTSVPSWELKNDIDRLSDKFIDMYFSTKDYEND